MKKHKVLVGSLIGLGAIGALAAIAVICAGMHEPDYYDFEDEKK